MAMAEIEVRDVRKVYHKDRIEVPVLNGLNLTVDAGEFAVLMGPSGSGKSTLLHLIGGLDQPTSGSIRVGDSNLEHLSERELTNWRSRNVGFIFQMYHLVPVLTAAQNVELPLLLFKMSSSERKERVKTALNVVGLSQRMDHRPNQLSGGQEQRVAIARAIVNHPAILLADEPTGNLDTENSEAVLGLLRDLNTRLGQTILMITHNPEAAAYGHRIVRMLDGRVVA